MEKINIGKLTGRFDKHHWGIFETYIKLNSYLVLYNYYSKGVYPNGQVVNTNVFKLRFEWNS